LKDFLYPGNLGHHTQLLQDPMQAFHHKCSKHHLDSEIAEKINLLRDGTMYSLGIATSKKFLNPRLHVFNKVGIE